MGSVSDVTDGPTGLGPIAPRRTCNVIYESHCKMKNTGLLVKNLLRNIQGDNSRALNQAWDPMQLHRLRAVVPATKQSVSGSKPRCHLRGKGKKCKPFYPTHPPIFPKRKGNISS